MAGIVVDRVYERRLASLVNSREQGLVARGRRGLERESLRVTPDGHIAQTPHPRALGSALTNPHITTDYSDWATNCPEYKVTAVQVSPSNGPSEWQESYAEHSRVARRIELVPAKPSKFHMSRLSGP